MTMPKTAPASAELVAPHFGLTKFRDGLRLPPVIRPHWGLHQDEITVHMTRARVRLHSELPETTVWTYGGHFPGPTIEVRSGHALRIAWSNELEGTIPIAGVQGPIAQAPTTVPGGYLDAAGDLLPGFSRLDGLDVLPAWSVTHLHGALTNAWNDGWSHNGTLTGHSQLSEYPNRQPSAALWYHDHAMAVTRFNVFAGLVGMYLIRDDEEDELGLPDQQREIPLILSDRNLDVDPATGSLTGRLLFKVPVVPSGAHVPFSGPFNLVNGVIWPHLNVRAQWYRFRVLNAASSRFYTLSLIDDTGTLHHEAVRIIGTDGGLLPEPAPLPAAGLVLAPAERVDLLIDFSRFRGRNLRLTNAASASPVEPDLLQFRVEHRERSDSFKLPAKLSASYVRSVHGTTVPDDHDHVFVGLVPPGTAGRPHPELWELRELTEPSTAATGVLQLKDPHNGAIRTFEKVASLFDETTTFFIDHGRWVVWNIIHLGGPAHPIHIHMVQLQLLSRKKLLSAANGGVLGFDVQQGRTTSPLEVAGEGRPIEKYEEGWKDTFQVQAGEWVTVASEFVGATGQFMYHCHILDHEDEGMMRPFVVHPPAVARFHVHPAGAGHGDHDAVSGGVPRSAAGRTGGVCPG